VDSQGSFKALVVSLLSSDSFLTRSNNDKQNDFKGDGK